MTVADLILNGSPAKATAEPTAEDNLADRPDAAPPRSIDKPLTTDEDAA